MNELAQTLIGDSYAAPAAHMLEGIGDANRLTVDLVHRTLPSIAHSIYAYHLGRIVLLRQLLGAWPPASGGFTW